MKPDRFDRSLFETKPKTRRIVIEIRVTRAGRARKCSRMRAVQRRRKV